MQRSIRRNKVRAEMRRKGYEHINSRLSEFWKLVFPKKSQPRRRAKP